jgi:glycerate dehydrogenase
MKISVILDPDLQPDLSKDERKEHWNRLAGMEGVDEISYVSLPLEAAKEEVQQACGDADAVFGVWDFSTLVDVSFLKNHPHLKYIASLGHGWHEYDVSLSHQYGITLANTVYGAHTVAEYAFALLMEVCHHTAEESRRIRETDWTKQENAHAFSMTLTPQIELYGKTMGIVGVGAIGFEMARIAHGFGMHVIGYSRHRKTGSAYSFMEQTEDLNELYGRADVISLHVPAGHETDNMINAGSIARMKDGVILINTARGSLIDEQALADALQNGKVSAAGLDVLKEEPPVHGSPLLKAPHTVITGHIAWLTREARLRAIDLAVMNYRHYREGGTYTKIN